MITSCVHTCVHEFYPFAAVCTEKLCSRVGVCKDNVWCSFFKMENRGTINCRVIHTFLLSLQLFSLLYNLTFQMAQNKTRADIFERFIWITVNV